MLLGEVGVARVNPYRFGQGQPPVHSAWFQPRPANGGHTIRGAILGLPPIAWTTSTRSGLHRASEDIGGDVRRGQKEGLVAKV